MATDNIARGMAQDIIENIIPNLPIPVIPTPPVTSKTFTITGTGSKKTFDITHNFNTSLTSSHLYDSNFKEVYTTIDTINSNQIKVSFFNAPILNKIYTIKISI